MTKETKDIKQLRLNMKQLINGLNKLSYHIRLIKGEFKDEKNIHSTSSSANIYNLF